MMDSVFAMLSEDPDMGPRLRDADVPQRLEFDDVGLVLNVRPARAGEQGNLWWTWSDDIDWTPRVRMSMSSETANRYFQGHENLLYAIARRRITTSGDLKAALELVPITKPVGKRYRELVAARYPHLAV